MKKKNPTYLMIEVFIVVILISILIAVSLPRFFQAQTASMVTRTLTDFNALHQAFEYYYIDQSADILDYDAGRNSSIPPHMMKEFYVYRCLTTPNSYITHIPVDIFQMQDVSIPHNDPPYYEYSAFTRYPTDVRWMLTSSGPDLKMDALWYYYRKRPKLDIYHSSNGMKSTGDIFASNRGVVDSLQ